MSGKYKKSRIIRRWSASAAMLAVCSLMGCGGAGADRLEVSSQPASEQDCPDGGSELTFGYDTNADGTIDDVSHVEVICSGEAGPRGEGGEEGRPLLVFTESANPDECENGGVTYTFGYDTDGDGAIDDAESVETVCNGVDGDDGLPMLLETADVGFDVCENGTGTTYTFGYDTAGDGEIDDVVSEETICVEVPSEAIVSGASVLYFVDSIASSSEGDVLLEGLETLDASGFIELRVAANTTGFIDELEGGTYDVVVHFAQGNPLSDPLHDLLVDWVESDGRLIFGTYTANSDDGLFAALETALAGSSNHDTIAFTTARSGYRVPAELALFTEPWTTHSLGLEPLGDGVSICEFDGGDSCAVLGNEGRTLQVGVLSDVFPAAQGDQIAANLLATVLESGF